MEHEEKNLPRKVNKQKILYDEGANLKIPYPSDGLSILNTQKMSENPFVLQRVKFSNAFYFVGVGAPVSASTGPPTKPTPSVNGTSNSSDTTPTLATQGKITLV